MIITLYSLSSSEYPPSESHRIVQVSVVVKHLPQRLNSLMVSNPVLVDFRYPLLQI